MKTLDVIVLGICAVILFIGGAVFGGATPQGKNIADKATAVYSKVADAVR